MTDKFKKVEKEYVLSDSSVNCYGYRLLTEGYQLAEYAKNPIGYYMHDREGGVVVRWEDLRVEDGRVYGKPCINLSNPRGQQTLDEAEAGFLNAASVGHIVVLEYSLADTDMLDGQTGPTIVKWFNRECSLVDIPGNSNALTSLFDDEGNALKLEDLMAHVPVVKTGQLPTIVQEPPTAPINNLVLDGTVLSALAAKGFEVTDGASLIALMDILKSEADKVPVLEAKVKNLEAASVSKEVDTILADAFAAKKITRDLKATLAIDYANNPAGLKALVDKMPAYQSVANLIERTAAGRGNEALWSWDDYEKNDPSGKKLKALMNDNPVHYKALFDERFVK